MRLLLKPLYLFWRIWFYLMMGLPLVIFFPILAILVLKERWYPLFYKAARIWSGFIIHTTGFISLRKNGTFYQKGESFMFVANHTSMLDVFQMFYTIKNPFVFVGKTELTKIPVFGFFYKRSAILVDRKDPKSKLNVFAQAQHKINLGFSICIFPEGGVPDDESIVLDMFKDGAFRLAIDHKLPIVPLVFPDNKKRFSYTFYSGSLGKSRSYVLPPISVNDYEMENRKELKEKTRQIILDKLMELNPVS